MTTKSDQEFEKAKAAKAKTHIKDHERQYGPTKATPRLSFNSGASFGRDYERKKLLPILLKIDQFFCERIIDPCGYDPEKESKEELVDQVKLLSEENEKMLAEIRTALEPDNASEL